MDWPSRSPDLNPTQHVWDELGRRLNDRPNARTTLDQLQQALTEEWNRIPNVIRRIVASMRRRRHAVINSIDGPTRYEFYVGTHIWKCTVF